MKVKKIDFDLFGFFSTFLHSLLIILSGVFDEQDLDEATSYTI